LYVKASSKNTELQKYWLGHSHYNISNYREAENIFSSLREDKNFGFRSQAMIALIKNYTEGSENSIAEFTKLLKDYPPTTEHYHFALLTLARLYLDTNEPDLALKYYDLYVKYYPTEIPDEILFEIGLMNKNNANYMKAISYFDMILKKPIKSEYYASAKILATISQKQSGEYSELETNLTDIISLNDILLQTLNSKYGLMDKYRDLRNNLKNSENNPAQKESILTQMEQVETLIFNTNKTVENLYKGDDITRLAAISIMEEEYIYYTQTIEMMNSVVELAKTTPNRRIPASIDKKIGIGEKDIIRLTILSFLGHLPEKKITTSDYEFAQTLATEKIYDLQLIDLWQDVNKVAKNVEYEAVALLADKYVSLLQENINSYNAIAKYRFSGAPSDEFKKILDDEIKLVTRNNHEMEILKQSVIESFNKKIAERLDNQKKVLVVENENLRNIYNTVLSNVINDVKQERDKNEFTLLDILFKQSKALDLEYQVKQIELRNNEQIKNSGNE
jgi:outer membrane protein assembly factor BamD (BamD/ComL family)